MKNISVIIVLLYFFSFCNAQTQKVEIFSDNTLLNVYYYQAEGSTKKPTLIWCHGNPGGKEEGKSQFANELNKFGINVIKFNYRGLWGTGGIFKQSNSIEDLSYVLDFVYKPENISQFNIDTTKIIIGSYSYGTGITMVSALKDSRIKNIFCLGPTDINYFYFTPECLKPKNNEQWREFNQYVNNVIWGPERKVDEMYAEFNIDVMINTYEYDFVSQAKKLKDKNLFIVVGLNDLTAPLEYHFLPLHREFVEMNHNYYKYKIIESDHYFRNLSASDRAQMISDWINK